MRVTRRAPRVEVGQRIRASVFNDLAGAVDSLALPRDVIEPRRSNEVGPVAESRTLALTATETARTSETVRVANPEDTDQFVDVARVQTLTLEVSNGEVWTLTLQNTE